MATFQFKHRTARLLKSDQPKLFRSSRMQLSTSSSNSIDKIQGFRAAVWSETAWLVIKISKTKRPLKSTRLLTSIRQSATSSLPNLASTTISSRTMLQKEDKLSL